MSELTNYHVSQPSIGQVISFLANPSRTDYLPTGTIVKRADYPELSTQFPYPKLKSPNLINAGISYYQNTYLRYVGVVNGYFYLCEQYYDEENTRWVENNKYSPNGINWYTSLTLTNTDGTEAVHPFIYDTTSDTYFQYIDYHNLRFNVGNISGAYTAGITNITNTESTAFFHPSVPMYLNGVYVVIPTRYTRAIAPPPRYVWVSSDGITFIKHTDKLPELTITNGYINEYDNWSFIGTANNKIYICNDNIHGGTPSPSTLYSINGIDWNYVVYTGLSMTHALVEGVCYTNNIYAISFISYDGNQYYAHSSDGINFVVYTIPYHQFPDGSFADRLLSISVIGNKFYMILHKSEANLVPTNYVTLTTEDFISFTVYEEFVETNNSFFKFISNEQIGSALKLEIEANALKDALYGYIIDPNEMQLGNASANKYMRVY